jgi:hypothetical protein
MGGVTRAGAAPQEFESGSVDYPSSIGRDRRPCAQSLADDHVRADAFALGEDRENGAPCGGAMPAGTYPSPRPDGRPRRRSPRGGGVSGANSGDGRTVVGRAWRTRRPPAHGARGDRVFRGPTWASRAARASGGA